MDNGKEFYQHTKNSQSIEGEKPIFATLTILGRKG